jgi:ATP-dependent DNA helicase RecG
MVDVSLIEETPFKKSIETSIITREDFASLISHIQREINQNHQVLIIYPLVESNQKVPYFSIDEARDFWEGKFEGVYVTHGKDKNKDTILQNFRDNGKILLATTVVEVGISLPRLTTIVIVGAERLGLASLHQLRGRVGRNGLRSWCYLYTNLNSPPKRLIEFCKTTNGFDIAKLDLKYRDSGDILDGTIQSGQKFRWLNLAEDEEIIKEAKERVFGGEK